MVRGRRRPEDLEGDGESLTPRRDRGTEYPVRSTLQYSEEQDNFMGGRLSDFGC